MILRIEDLLEEEIKEFLSTLPKCSQIIFKSLFLNNVHMFPGDYSINDKVIQKLNLTISYENPNLTTKIILPNRSEIQYGTLKAACRLKTPSGILKGVHLQSSLNKIYRFCKPNKREYSLEHLN
jgi:hypothetical protein